MEQLESNGRPDNVIENWRTKAWGIVEKANKGHLTEEEFSRLFKEFIKLHPDLLDKEYFNLLIEEIPKWLESDKSTFDQFRELISRNFGRSLKRRLEN